MPLCYRNLNEILTTSDGLAEVFGVTRPRIIQLANEDILKRDKNSKYVVGEAVKNYLNYIKKDNGGGKKEQSDEQVDYWKEKALHERAKRKLTEINLDQKVGQIHSSKDVELVMTEMLVTLRTKLQGFPTQISGKLVGQTQDVIYEIMNSELEKILLELSEYDSKLFDTETEDRENGENDEFEADD